MDMKCPGCCKFPALFSHAQRSSRSLLLRSALLHQPAGAEARLMERCSVRQKQH
ncbi:RS27 protein, partial [Fregata magnificens]|nr:RS27 protein [Fregata magnificens]